MWRWIVGSTVGLTVGLAAGTGELVAGGSVLVGEGIVGAGHKVGVAETTWATNVASAVPSETAPVAGAVGLQATTSPKTASTNRTAILILIRLHTATIVLLNWFETRPDDLTKV